jgi:hypothetical protein
MEAVSVSKLSVNVYQIRRRHVPEDDELNVIFKYHIVFKFNCILVEPV